MDEKQKAIDIITKLQGIGHTAVLAGGCVRDMLLNVEPHDYDVATSATPNEVADVFPNSDLVGAKFGVVIVNHVEVATFRIDGFSSDGRRPDEVIFSKSMKEDSKRRDFTINAMYFDPITNHLYDWHHGEVDLFNKMLIAVGNPEKRFEEDYLRIMRGFRFALKYDMLLGLETQEAMMNNRNGLKEIAPERILEELLKIFSVANRVRSFNLMRDLWITLIPEVFALRGVEQSSNWHSEGDVFVHTSLVIGNLEDMNVQDPIVYIAAVLHDIGKPQTAIRKSPTSVSFHGHEKIGADMAKGILSRMKFSKKDSDKILFVIEKHMIMHKFLDMRKSKQKRLFHEEHFDALWKVSQADSRGAIADSDERNEEKERILESIQKRIDEFDAYEEPLVSGLDLISLGMKPGPSFREILNTVYDAQLEGEQSKDVLIELVKSM